MNRIGNKWERWGKEKEGDLLRIAVFADTCEDEERWLEALGAVCRPFDVACAPWPGQPDPSAMVFTILNDCRKRMTAVKAQHALDLAAAREAAVLGADDPGGEDAVPDDDQFSDISAHTWELDGSIFTLRSGSLSDAEEEQEDGGDDGAAHGGDGAAGGVDGGATMADDNTVGSGDLAEAESETEEEDSDGASEGSEEQAEDVDMDVAFLGEGGEEDDEEADGGDLAAALQEQQQGEVQQVEAGGDLEEPQNGDLELQQQQQQQPQQQQQQEEMQDDGAAALEDNGAVLNEFHVELEDDAPPTILGKRRRTPTKFLCSQMTIAKARRFQRYE